MGDVNVKNIRSDGGKTGDLTIRWDPVPREFQNAPGIYYRIFYKRVGVDKEIDYQQKTLQKAGNIQFFVIRIQRQYYFTEYEVKIQVFNDKCLHSNNCKGPISEPVRLLSAEDLPQVAPTNVAVRPHNSTALIVKWNALPDVREKIRGELIGHRIKYWRQDLNEVTESQYVLSRSVKNEAVIIGLLPNTYYWVRVMAYNHAGPGPESERFLERTFKLRPQKPPSAVQVFGINPSTVKVTWRYVSPTVQEEPLTGYKHLPFFPHPHPLLCHGPPVCHSHPNRSVCPGCGSCLVRGFIHSWWTDWSQVHDQNVLWFLQKFSE